MSQKEAVKFRNVLQCSHFVARMGSTAELFGVCKYGILILGIEHFSGKTGGIGVCVLARVTGRSVHVLVPHS